MDWFDNWALTLAIFGPLIGIAAMIAVPREREQMHKLIALGTSSAVLLLGIGMLVGFDQNSAAAPQYEVNMSWIDVINSRYHLFIDGISLPLLLLSMLITTVCIIYSWSHIPDPRNYKAFLSLILLLETGINGAFAAQDLVLFFVFFEVVSTLR